MVTNILIAGEKLNEKFIDKLYNKLKTHAVVETSNLKSRALKRYMKEIPVIMLTTIDAVRAFTPSDFCHYAEKNRVLPVFFSETKNDLAYTTFLAIEEAVPIAVSVTNAPDDTLDELVDIVVGNM